jgi:hypothetical protein
MDEIQTAAADTLPEVSTEPTATDAAPEASDTLSVKFNKQVHTLSREDATRYAQKGMKSDTVEPLLTTLKQVATREGKTLAQWVDTLGDRQAPTPEEALTQRLAAEYTALRAFVPDVGEFGTLPPEAVRQAVGEGIPLLDAYLRYAHRERCRIETERAAQAAAAAAATGTQSAGGGAEVSSVEAAMLRGVWGG